MAMNNVHLAGQDPREALQHSLETEYYGYYFALNNLNDLVQLFEQFLKDGEQISYLDFHSHGSPGFFEFPNGIGLYRDELHRLRNRAFHKIFKPNAKIKFWSCRLAEGAKGELFLTIQAKALARGMRDEHLWSVPDPIWQQDRGQGKTSGKAD